MSRSGFRDARSLFSNLLDRHEANPAASRLTSAIDIDVFKSVSERDAFDDELALVERMGGITLIRKGPRSERTVTGAKLANPTVLYEHLSRTPSASAVDDLLAPLRSDAALSPAAREIVDATAAAWTRGVSNFGLRKGDVRGLQNILELASAANARAASRTEGEVDFRTFSRSAVKDSKALERSHRHVAAVMMRLETTLHTDSGLEAEELLASVGITKLPQPVLISGPIAMGEVRLPALPYLGIPPERASEVALIRCPSYVLTVENYASFVRHVRAVDVGEALVIYSGGFPSRAVLTTVLRLASEANAPTFHWGDMDAGGVRIFRHLEEALKANGVTLRPHLMERTLLEAGGIVTEPRPGSMRNMRDSALAELADVICETGLVHEQEELTPTSPLDQTLPLGANGGAEAVP